MTICPTCNENNNDHWMFCATCGEELIPIGQTPSSPSTTMGHVETGNRQVTPFPDAQLEPPAVQSVAVAGAGAPKHKGYAATFPDDFPNPDNVHEVGIAPSAESGRPVAPFPTDIPEPSVPAPAVRAPEPAPGERRPVAPFPDDVPEAASPAAANTPPARANEPPATPFPDVVPPEQSRAQSPARRSRQPSQPKPNLDAIAENPVSVTQSVIIAAGNPSYPPAAGAVANSKVCEMCGFDLLPGQSYCQECGIAIKKPDSSPPK